jgi:hypothetical protein
MKTDLDLDLVIYGVLLAALGVLAQRLVPELGWATLVTGTVGGVVIGLNGVIGWCGLRTPRRRVWTVITLSVVSIALLVQAVRAWLAVRAGVAAVKPVAVILTVLLVFGIGQLFNHVNASQGEE